MLFVGNDWAEAHHDVEIVDQEGRVLVRRRLPEGVAGVGALHELVADHLGEADEPGQVLVGIETDRGPWFQALVAAGYTVYPINPLQVARYRERHGVAGGKSDPGDAHVLAEIVRLDRAHHRAAAGDSELAEQVRLAARAHQTMIWTRQRSTNTLRSLLREFYPAALVAFGDDLAGREEVSGCLCKRFVGSEAQDGRYGEVWGSEATCGGGGGSAPRSGLPGRVDGPGR